MIKIFVRLLLLIGLTTLNAEYLLNRQSNTWLLLLCILIEAALLYVLLIPLIKKIFNQ